MTHKQQLGVEAELLAATGYKRVVGETDQQYRRHIAEQALDLDAVAMRKLSPAAKDWAFKCDGSAFPDQPDTKHEAKPKRKNKSKPSKPNDTPTTRRKASRKVRTHYERMHAALIEGRLRELTLWELRVYFVMTARAYKGDEVWASVAMTAKDLGFKPTDSDGNDTDVDGSMRNARRATKGLEKKGFIELAEAGGTRQSRYKTNTWRVVDFGHEVKRSEGIYQGTPGKSNQGTAGKSNQGTPGKSNQPNTTQNRTRNETPKPKAGVSASLGGGCPEDEEGNHLGEDEKVALKRMRKFGLDKKARTLLDQEGLAWCTSLLRLLRHKKLNGYDKTQVTKFARWCAKYPEKVNFNELDDSANSDGMNHKDDYTPSELERVTPTFDDEGIAYD